MTNECTIRKRWLHIVQRQWTMGNVARVGSTLSLNHKIIQVKRVDHTSRNGIVCWVARHGIGKDSTWTNNRSTTFSQAMDKLMSWHCIMPMLFIMLDQATVHIMASSDFWAFESCTFWATIRSCVIIHHAIRSWSWIVKLNWCEVQQASVEGCQHFQWWTVWFRFIFFFLCAVYLAQEQVKLTSSKTWDCPKHSVSSWSSRRCGSCFDSLLARRIEAAVSMHFLTNATHKWLSHLSFAFQGTTESLPQKQKQQKFYQQDFTRFEQ